jgi:hypothetical protein
LRSHRYRRAQADSISRFAFDSSDGNKRALLYDPSQQGLPLGRDFITYLFIKFAERSLETKRSMSFLVISYRRDHLQLSSPMQSPFMPFDMMLYPVRRTLRLSLRISRAGCTGQLLRAKGAGRTTGDRKLYSRNGIRPRDGDGERFIHSVVRGVEAVRSRRKTRWARVVVPPWSYLRSGDRTPNRDVSRWRWAAPMYNGMKISNDVGVLEHKNSHNK